MPKVIFHMVIPMFLEAAFFTTVFRRCVLLNIQNAAMHAKSRFQTFVDWPISLINKWRRGHGWVVVMRNSQDWSCLNLETPENGSEGVRPFGLSEILVRTWLGYRSSSRRYPPFALSSIGRCWRELRRGLLVCDNLPWAEGPSPIRRRSGDRLCSDILEHSTILRWLIDRRKRTAVKISRSWLQVRGCEKKIIVNFRLFITIWLARFSSIFSHFLIRNIHTELSRSIKLEICTFKKTDIYSFRYSRRKIAFYAFYQNW